MTRLRHLLLTLLVLLAIQSIWAEEELLDPDQAIGLEMSAIDGDLVRARWVIADGYYLTATRSSSRATRPVSPSVNRACPRSATASLPSPPTREEEGAGEEPRLHHA